LALARADRPDLILADIAMPRLDGLGLCAALREEPALGQVPVVLLSDGAPPQAVWGGGGGASRSLIDAVMATLLARLEAPAGVRIEPPAARMNEPVVEQDPEPAVDEVEREDVRAQSMVAMHREPANHVSLEPEAVWRLRVSGAPEADGSASGFEAELSAMSRILGAGFVSLLAATIALLVWRIANTPDSESPPTQAATAVSSEREVPTPPARDDPEPAGQRGIAAFAGELVSEMDRSLGALAGQGALRLDGPQTVTVSVDGEDAGSLPVALPLDEGVHRVRYRFEDRVSDRFYFVKSGATRRLVVITRPDGFVDAR
jgi:CheY-like chemotaxis protein